MGVEDTDDLAGFYDPDEFATRAIYRPPSGVALEVVLDLTHGDERLGAGLGAIGAARPATVRMSELAEPVEDAQVDILDDDGNIIENLFVKSFRADGEGVEWFLDLGKA